MYILPVVNVMFVCRKFLEIVTMILYNSYFGKFVFIAYGFILLKDCYVGYYQCNYTAKQIP